ncbi:glycolate oxidase subunit GlcE [Methylococcus sp. EFPC2]|nr:glycolate oxidase subunit GlcE [Methylococcus sp. EFPC2]
MSASPAGQDSSAALCAAVAAAARTRVPLCIRGSGSKAFYGRAAEGQTLDVRGHRGIVHYEPTELVLTARAGTRLAEIEAALAERGQMLAFEPPHFGPDATLGGTLACGLSGPRRPWSGSARDCVLGVRIVDGRGEMLRFGGEVMKNVAGFDISRLMVGALGGLGVLLDISLKVLPLPEAEITLTFELPEDEAIATAQRWAGSCLPLSAVCHDGTRLFARLAGAEAALRETRRVLGGEELAHGEGYWGDLREQRLPFFAGDGDLWRLSVPPASPAADLPGTRFIDWGGALRWLKTDAPAEAVFAEARKLGGHATLFRTCASANGRFQALPDKLHALHVQLKRAFDPQGILNPGRLYPDC